MHLHTNSIHVEDEPMPHDVAAQTASGCEAMDNSTCMLNSMQAQACVVPGEHSHISAAANGRVLTIQLHHRLRRKLNEFFVRDLAIPIAVSLF